MLDMQDIKKIAASAVGEDGRLLSFEEQLDNYNLGILSQQEYLVLALRSALLNVPLDDMYSDYPLVMKPTTFAKVENKHFLSRERLIELPQWIDDHVIAFDSIGIENGVVILTNETDLNDCEIIIPVHYDKSHSAVEINEVTSVYGKRNLESLLTRTFEKNLTFYVTDNTKEWLATTRLQLPVELTTLLLDKSSVRESESQEEAKPGSA